MIRPFAETDNPSGFSCGSHELDRYLKTHALMNSAAGVSVTYVHTDVDAGIDGFVTLAGTSVALTYRGHISGTPPPSQRAKHLSPTPPAERTQL